MACITYLDYIVLKKKDERHFRRGGCGQVYTYGQTIHIMCILYVKKNMDGMYNVFRLYCFEKER